jgi:hypothetical protein
MEANSMTTAPAPERPERIKLPSYDSIERKKKKGLALSPIEKFIWCEEPSGEAETFRNHLAQLIGSLAQPVGAVPVRSAEVELYSDSATRFAVDAVTELSKSIDGLEYGSPQHLTALSAIHSHLEAFAATLEQQSETSGAQWQPIETAPLDGTVIDAARLLEDGRYLEFRCWWTVDGRWAKEGTLNIGHETHSLSACQPRGKRGEVRLVIRLLEIAQTISGAILTFIALTVLVYMAKEIGWEQPFWWLVGISGGTTIALIFLRDMPAAYRNVFGNPTESEAREIA